MVGINYSVACVVVCIMFVVIRLQTKDGHDLVNVYQYHLSFLVELYTVVKAP